ncbi:MAG: hemolysin III family protein, partial [Bacteroidota bacterium]
ASTVYHSVIDQRLKHIFRIVDHISIYFLIAGTHTPLVLLYLHQPSGWYFLTGLWLMVLLGTIFKVFFTGRYEFFSITLYILMGWSGLLVLPQMFEHMSNSSLYCLIAGGVLYSGGVIFYVWKRLPYHHAIWHLFVIAGTAAHFIAMMICFL